MVDADGTRKEAKYSNFNIVKAEGYKLEVSGYTSDPGDAYVGDSLTPLNGKKFTTYDDTSNDPANSCATTKESAGW